ncbi:MAG TPA: hypothetical protein VGM50_02490 [Gemmatimonadaceae bacterium]
MSTTTIMAGIATISFATAAAAQRWCEDTRYERDDAHADAHADAFHSRYHVVELYGETDGRSTNFYHDDYDGGVSTTTLRVTVPRLSALVATPLALPEPFVSATLSSLTALDRENRVDAAVGVQWWPFERATLPNNALRWLPHLRAYAAAYEAGYLRRGAPQPGWPTSDTRYGVELYRECNMFAAHPVAERTFWLTAWGDVSYRRTNFVTDQFHAWTGGFVPQIGIRVLRGHALTPMPYITAEITKTGRSEEFWQNHALAGAGLAFMPFRWLNDSWRDVLGGTRVFGEELWLVRELASTGGTAVPPRDARVGVAFVVNRW